MLERAARRSRQRVLEADDICIALWHRLVAALLFIVPLPTRHGYTCLGGEATGMLVNIHAHVRFFVHSLLAPVGGKRQFLYGSKHVCGCVGVCVHVRVRVCVYLWVATLMFCAGCMGVFALFVCAYDYSARLTVHSGANSYHSYPPRLPGRAFETVCAIQF